MEEYVVERLVSLYDNSDNQIHAIPLTDSFSFRIKIPKEYPVVKVGIRFATYMQKCEGLLNISFKTEEGTVQFSLDVARIKDNEVVDFDFRKLPQKTKYIIITLDVINKNTNKLAIWLNGRGPCIRIAGLCSRTVNVTNPIKFSLVLPVYKTDLKLLKDTINSVKNQLYTNWELCVVDDGSKDVGLENFLRSQKDSRIKVKINKINKGIALSSNECIKMVTGDFVGFLDHDDLIEPTTLIEIIDLLEKNPELDMVYTDEDKIDKDNRRYGPFFKPDWNYPMLLSYMYTCHLTFYRSSIINEIGGLREDFEGSQDYDLVLRFIEKTDRIGHVPLILYHWRSTENSTAVSIANKPLARINAIKAISEHLERTKQNAFVEGGFFQGMYNVRRQLDEEPSVVVIIPFKDQIHYLENLLYSMRITSYKNYEVHLIDNNSNKKTKEAIANLAKKYHCLVSSYSKPFNFSKINNYAASMHQTSKYLLFLNNDIEILNSEWLKELVVQAEQPQIAAVGAKLLYVDHRIQHAGIFIGINGIAAHGHKFLPDYNPGTFARPHIVQEISAVTGACLLVKNILFQEVGGFESKLPTAFNDIDLCLELRNKGYKIIYTPHARLIHHESQSRGYDTLDDPSFKKAIEFMDNKWGCLNYRDPYYNPNLTKLREDFSFGD